MYYIVHNLGVGNNERRLSERNGACNSPEQLNYADDLSHSYCIVITTLSYIANPWVAVVLHFRLVDFQVTDLDTRGSEVWDLELYLYRALKLACDQSCH